MLGGWWYDWIRGLIQSPQNTGLITRRQTPRRLRTAAHFTPGIETFFLWVDCSRVHPISVVNIKTCLPSSSACFGLNMITSHHWSVMSYFNSSCYAITWQCSSITLDFKSKISDIRLEKLPPEVFSAGFSILQTISRGCPCFRLSHDESRGICPAEKK